MRDINGAKAGGSQKKPYRAPVSATSTQTMRIKYGISEGTILGFGQNARYEDMLKRIYLDGTPIMAEDGTQLLDVTVEFRDGTQDQEPINGLPSVSIETDVGVEVKLGAPVSRSFDRSDTTSFDVRISVPTLYEGDDSGRSDFGVVEFKIDVSTDGGAFTEAGRFTIKEKILNGYTNTYNVPVTKGATHVVRVSRLNSEVVNDFSVNKLVLDAIVEITDVKLRYSNTAILYLEYDAEQFSNVPKLEMRVFGKNDILIPANYDPVSRTYATTGAGTTNGVWNGTWKRGYTDNPVWITLDLMLAKRYGLGDKIELSMINKWELYGVAQYCDELVPDGEGGTEPRFTCNNAYQQKAEDAYRVLKDLAASFRAKVVWDGEFITFSADVPRDPVFAFTDANTKDITYSSTQDAAQRNLINVQYYDKKNKFTSDVVMQRSTSNILSRGKVVDGNFTSLGCTSKGQAQRAASYVVNSELYETEIVTFTTGLEGGILRLNDVFHLADQSVAGRTLGGRVAAVNGKVITLDREVPAEVNAGSDTQLILNQNNAQIAPNPVVSISADRLSVTLRNDPPASIQAGIVWALLTRDLVPQTFYVTDLEFDEAEMTFAVSGLQYNASKYAAIDGSARIVSPPISIIEHAMLTAPLIVVATYNTRIVQDISVCSIDVSWAQSANAVKYQLEMQKEGEPWRILGQFTSLSDTLDNMYMGAYTFRVCAYDSLGNASKYTYSAPLLVAGKVLPPPMLNSYGVKGILFGYQHDWSYPAHTEDSRAVRIRFTTIDPAVTLDALNYIDIAYPTTTYVEQDVSVGLKTWFSAAIVDKYGLVGTYTPWQFALPSVDPEQVLDLLSGQLTTSQLDEDLRTDIATGVAADAKAAAAKLAADAAAQAASAAKTAADNAQLSANSAGTAASNAQTAADQAKADVTALTTSTNTTASELRGRLTTAENGLTQEKLDRAAGDTAVVGQLNTYKTSNDAALAAVQQKAEAATTSSSSNATAITNLTSTVNTKNRTYQQATAPTANLVVGDLWINTTDGANNELKRWNGTSWAVTVDPRIAATATATTALTTRVSTAEGNITSQGTRVTNLENSVNHATTGLATKASSAALDSLDSKVTAIDGRVTSNSSSVTSLNNSLATTNTNVTAAQTAATDAMTAAGQKGKVIFGTTAPVAADQLSQNLWIDTTGSANTPKRWNGTAWVVVTDKVATDALAAANAASNLAATKADSSALTALDSKVTTIDGKVTTNASNITTLQGKVTTVENGLATKADGSALSSLTTRVATAEGNITSQGTRVTNLENSVNNATTGLSTKASASALTTLNNQVQHSTTGLSAVNSKVDNLKATIENTTNGLASKASSSALDTLSNKVNHSTTGLDAVANKTTVLEATLSSFKAAGRNYLLNSKAAGSKSVNPEINTILAPSTPIRMSFDIEIRTPVQAGYRNRIGFECSFSVSGTTYYFGVWVDDAASVGAGKRRVYATQMLPSSWTAGVSSFPTTFTYHNQTSGGDFTVSNIKLEVGDAYTDWSPAPEDNASASAVESLTTRVTTAEGTISSEATKLGTLTTTVGNHTSSISTQQTVINGLSAKATLQVVAGNTIGGVALGNNAGVVNMIVRSNTFAIAPPTSAGAGNAGKYAFTYQSTSTKLPNGTVVPAGLYVDQAFIGQISASKINADSLSAISANLGTIKVGTANIDNGAITTAKIGDLQVDTLKIKDDAVTGSVAAAGVSSLTITSIGGRLVISIGLQVSHTVYEFSQSIAIRVLRNGVVLKTIYPSYTYYFGGSGGTTRYWEYIYLTSLPDIVDVVTAGTYTYTVQAYNQGTTDARSMWRDITSNSQTWVNPSNLSLSIMELKK